MFKAGTVVGLQNITGKHWYSYRIKRFKVWPVSLPNTDSFRQSHGQSQASLLPSLVGRKL